MPSQYAVQHEFDHEPTYVVHDSDTKLKDQVCVAFGSNLPVALRMRLAGLVRDELNQVNQGQPVRRTRPLSNSPAKLTPLSTIVICVSGGVVQEVIAEQPAPRVILVDWDAETCEEGPNRIHFLDAHQKPLFAWVAELPTSDMPPADSDVSLALAAANIALEPVPLPNGVRDPNTLSQEELTQFAQRVQAVFYLDISGEREFWNPNKEWNGADLLDELAQVLREYGLVPTRIADAPL